MQGIDTNILLRLLVEDPTAPEQTRLACEHVSAQPRVFVAATVLPELIWVLQSGYGMGKPQLLTALDAVLAHPKLLIESREWFAGSVELFRAGGVDFADALILKSNRNHGSLLRTFDRKLAKQDGAELLKSGGSLIARTKALKRQLARRAMGL